MKVTLATANERMALYIDNELIYENNTISLREGLSFVKEFWNLSSKAGLLITFVGAGDDFIKENGGFPQKLSEIQEKVQYL